MTDHVRRVLVVDADQALFALVEEWLIADGYEAVRFPSNNGGGAFDGRIDLALIDIPFPRQGGTNQLRRIAADFPSVPILALSSTFFSGVESDGAVARALGVSAVMPKPLKRDTLITSIKRLIPPRP